MNQTIKKRTKTFLLIGAFIALILIFTYFIFKDAIYVRYYNFVNNYFNPGDKVYAEGLFTKSPFKVGGTEKSMMYWRIIRPVDNNSSKKTYAVYYYSKVIVKDSLLKYNTAYIGTYINHKIIDVLATNGQYVSFNFYGIAPNLKGVNSDYVTIDRLDLPKGYTWADSTLYLMSSEVSGVETARFLKK